MYTIQKLERSGSHSRTASSDDGIPEQLKCPICFEVFVAQIYQCKNGHTICDQCLSRSVVACPQCRIPFMVDGELIRVRSLESLLDSMLVPCPYKRIGACKEMISRKELKEHAMNCVYNGKSVQLCKQLGYQCDYWSNAMNSKSAVEHFQLHHKAIIVHGSGVAIKMDSLKCITDGMKTDAVWAPVILCSEGAHLMILTFLNDEDKSLSWTCFNMTHRESPIISHTNVEVQFCITSQTGKSLPPLKWKIPSISILNSAEIIAFPMNRMPIHGLEQCYVGKKDGSLRVAVGVSCAQATEPSTGFSSEDITGGVPLQLAALNNNDIITRNGNGIRRDNTSIPVWPKLTQK